MSKPTSKHRNSPSLPQFEDRLILGDCIAHLKTIAAESVDLVCTDPPYGIGFRGNAWDRFPSLKPAANATRKTHFANSARNDFYGFLRLAASECLRVLKPGAIMFVTMTPRQDSLARALLALEDAGLETGFTSLYWTFASGFPKAMNIGKAIDKRLGLKRAIVGHRVLNDIRGNRYGSRPGAALIPRHGEAKSFDGAFGGFQPKPAVEVVIVAMKALAAKTFADQALANGKGVTWLDPCRVPTRDRIQIHDAPSGTFGGSAAFRRSSQAYRDSAKGRFPANLCVSDDVLGDYSKFFALDAWANETLPFLICPKAGRAEKERGLASRSARASATSAAESGNRHPTAKPLKLMAYLIALGSRKGDIVLDPFLGSGTTAVAARLLGRRFIGIERDPDYFRTARDRIASVGRSHVRPCAGSEPKTTSEHECAAIEP